MKMNVFQVVVPSNLGEVYRRFSGSRCLYHQVAHSLMMEVAVASETFVVFCQITWRNKPEESHLLIKPGFRLNC
jgi:hypothetical protein